MTARVRTGKPGARTAVWGRRAVQLSCSLLLVVAIAGCIPEPSPEQQAQDAKTAEYESIVSDAQDTISDFKTALDDQTQLAPAMTEREVVDTCRRCEARMGELAGRTRALAAGVTDNGTARGVLEDRAELYGLSAFCMSNAAEALTDGNGDTSQPRWAVAENEEALSQLPDPGSWGPW